jgi:hypothetical protein
MGNRIRTKNSGKKDITLMTLIANEATADARNILKKYGKPDADGYDDLEVKLADLYFKADDKNKLEKELAEIHPHKKWLMRVLVPPVIEVAKEEVKVEVKPEPIIEKKSNADGYSNCSGCMSNASGESNNSKGYTPMDYVGIIGVVAVVGIAFYSISKATK